MEAGDRQVAAAANCSSVDSDVVGVGPQHNIGH